MRAWEQYLTAVQCRTGDSKFGSMIDNCLSRTWSWWSRVVKFEYKRARFRVDGQVEIKITYCCLQSFQPQSSQMLPHRQQTRQLKQIRKFHIEITCTEQIQLKPYSFKPKVKNIDSFYYFEDPVNATTSLLRPGLYGPKSARKYKRNVLMPHGHPIILLKSN